MKGNLELLNSLYQISNMAVTGITDVKKMISNKDNKIKTLLDDINEEYKNFERKCIKELKSHKQEPEPYGLMAKAMEKLGVKREIGNDNSDAKIADMLIQGLTMAKLELDKKIKKYEKDVDKGIINLAKDINKKGNEYIEKLKQYL